MHRHVGNERAGSDITRRVAAEQRAAERRAGQLDDIEAGLLERDADDLEILALAGERDTHRGCAGSSEDGLLAGVIDAGISAVLVLDLLGVQSSALSSVRSISAMPRSLSGRRALRPAMALSLPARLGSTARTVTGNTPPSLVSTMPKVAANLTSGGAASKRDGERIARGIDERATGEIGDAGRQHDLRVAAGGKGALEFEIGDLGVVPDVIVERGRARAAVGEAQAHGERLRAVDGGGEADNRPGGWGRRPPCC